MHEIPFYFYTSFQVICLAIFESNFRRVGLQNRRFRMEGIAKIDLSWKSFLKNSGMDLKCFCEALGTVFRTF